MFTKWIGKTPASTGLHQFPPALTLFALGFGIGVVLSALWELVTY